MIIKPHDPVGLKERLGRRPLVLFGMGDLGKRILAYCQEHDIPVACVVDNRPTGTVASPAILREKCQDANILIASNMYFDAIQKQVRELGFPDEQILSYRLFVADTVTWAELDAKANWERMRIRVKQLSPWIDEQVDSVVDYGAGEMFLQTLLRPGVKYTPIDFIRRSDATVLCDLNSGNFPNLPADSIVLAAVLEFITTAAALLHHCGRTCKRRILVSYITLDSFPDPQARRASSYLSDLSGQVIADILAEHGFILKATQTSLAHPLETLYCFEKR